MNVGILTMVDHGYMIWQWNLSVKYVSAVTITVCSQDVIVHAYTIKTHIIVDHVLGSQGCLQ